MADRFCRLRIEGSLPGGEVWSINPSFVGNFTTIVPQDADLYAWAQSVASNLSTDIGAGLASVAGTQTGITGVRAELYGPNGKVEAYQEALLSSPWSGTGTLKTPGTTAVALSLYSGIPGRSYRGRLFWPALAVNLNSGTGRIDFNQQLANEGAAMLHAWEGRMPGAFDPVLAVWSRTLQSGVAVNQIRVGNVPDVVRRRKDSLVELYARAAYPLP